MQRLLGKLGFDHRPNGHAGLAPLQPFEPLQLPAGARLVEEGPAVDLRKLGEIEVPADLTVFDAKGVR
eukprot:12449882-Alexandrium_andersonii.AAC.1